MPERTVAVRFYTVGGEVFERGDVLEVTDEEARSGDALGAFEPVEPPADSDSLKGAALDEAIKEAGIEGASTMTADEKRDALREAR